MGRRKLWGTKRVDTEEEVKAFLMSRVSKAASIEIKHVFKSEGGRFRWWLWLMGKESALKLENESSFGEFWKLRRGHLFRVSGGASSGSVGEREAVWGSGSVDRGGCGSVNVISGSVDGGRGGC